MLSSGQEVIIGAVTDPSFGKSSRLVSAAFWLRCLRTSLSVWRRDARGRLSMLDGIAAARSLKGCAVLRGGPQLLATPDQNFRN